MKDENRLIRQEEIARVAYALLAERGYAGASMLAIAKRASASNETLYNWYGNKQGLFRALIETNASRATTLLEEPFAGGEAPLERLAALGPVLLALVTGSEAIVLNRAAAGDVSDTGTLGQAIAEFGRGRVAPLVARLIAKANESGAIDCSDTAEAVETYFGLLIGDLQIRRVIGVLPPLAAEEVEARSRRAFALFVKLYSRCGEPGDGGRQS